MFKCQVNLVFKCAAIALLAIFSFNCSPCFADAGTPMIWGTMLHLVVGNAFIGLFEAALIAHYFKIGFWRIVWLMIIANYVSSVIGLVSIPHLEATFFGANDGFSRIYMLPMLFWAFVLLLFVITVFVEWPFVFFGFPSSKGRLYKSLLGSLLAQACSYCLLLPLYALISPNTLMSETKFTQSLDFSKNKKAYVYFLGNEDHSLYRVRLDGSKPERLLPKIPVGMNAIATYHDKKDWLIIAFNDKNYHSNSYKPLLKILNPSATRLDSYSRREVWGSVRAAYVDLASPAPPSGYGDLEGQPTPTWDIYWANAGFQSGIDIRPRTSKHQYYLALDTPLLQLWCKHVSVLPGDQLIFDLAVLTSSKRDIVLYDLRSKQLASIALGRSPIVLLDGATEEFTGALANEKDGSP